MTRERHIIPEAPPEVQIVVAGQIEIEAKLDRLLAAVNAAQPAFLSLREFRRLMGEIGEDAAKAMLARHGVRGRQGVPLKVPYKVYRRVAAEVEREIMKGGADDGQGIHGAMERDGARRLSGGMRRNRAGVGDGARGGAA